eukprot:353088-Chlamydomonas_euryale.AAC.7
MIWSCGEGTESRSAWAGAGRAEGRGRKSRWLEDKLSLGTKWLDASSRTSWQEVGVLQAEGKGLGAGAEKG